MVLGRTGVAVIALGAMATLSPREAPDAGVAADAGTAAVVVPSLTEAELEAAVAELLGKHAGSEEWRKLGPAAAVPLRKIAADPRASDADRCQAAFALAQQQGPAAVADLEPLLQDPRESLRLGAARGLGQAGGDDAKKALEDRLELEETPVVREAIQRTLTLMQP